MHTSGPWKLDHEKLEYLYDDELFIGYSIFNDDLDQIAIIPTDQVDEIACIANGYLLAASPDLLEACKAAFDAMGAHFSLVPAGTVSQADHELYEMLREAIAKAEGESAQSSQL